MKNKIEFDDEFEECATVDSKVRLDDLTFEILGLKPGRYDEIVNMNCREEMNIVDKALLELNKQEMKKWNMQF